MAIRDQYITQVELLQIADTINRLTWLETKLAENTAVSTGVLFDDDGGGRVFKVWDSNGELLGHIGHGDSGFAFYLDDGQEVSETP